MGSQVVETVPMAPDSLTEAALTCIRAGVSIVPIDHETKRPFYRLLPKDGDGKRRWEPYQRQIVDETTARTWFTSGAQSFAVVGGKVSGGLLVLDFDVERFYVTWREAVGELADGLPVQRTGGGGYQVFLRCDSPGGNDKLAWAADDREDTGRTIAIETRGEGGYAVAPPSLHPSGNRYEMVTGSLSDIPVIGQARVDALLAAARRLDERPHTRQERERLEHRAREAHQNQRARNRGQASVIDAFNAAHPIEAVLESHGYTRGSAGRYIRPGGKSESVSVKDGRSCHWSSDDPLNDGKVKSGCGVHDAFDVYCCYDHGGDMKAAVKAAADALGLSSQSHEKATREPSQATMLVDLASEAELFHDAQHDAYVTIPIQDHRETHSLKSKAFRRWLAGRFWTEHRKAPHGQAAKNALATLESKALFDGPQEAVAVRLADHDDAIWLDLADERWRAVKVTSEGWQVVGDPPVRFLRPRGLLALPVPATGGTVESLRRFVNLANDADWVLLASWILAAMRPKGPYPVLAVSGEQGSAKSTLCRLVRAVVDPNIAPLRTGPREVRDLMIAASNSWILAYDNLSQIPLWLSDALCRLATGGGFSTRELYTDDEEIIFDAMRPVMINGIEELATRSDLLDRAICLYLPTISDDSRKTEQQVFQDFKEQQPSILGAFLNAVSGALRRLPTTRLEKPPRMADFSVWAAAGEEGLGLEPRAFISAYHSNREDANGLALEASLLAPVIQEFIGDRHLWEGTAQDLLDEIDGIDRFEKQRGRRDWPKTPQALGKRLRRVAPNLRRAGIDVAFDRGKGKDRKRIIRLARLDTQPSEMSEPSDAGPEDGQTEGIADMSDMSDNRIQEDTSLAP